MRALVLAGGYATRLRPISYALPKHLFPILGKPVIERTLDMLRTGGVTEAVLAVNYMADRLQAHLGSKYRGIHLRYSVERHPLGTGGPIKLASRHLRGRGTFAAMNGDVVADFDIRAIKELHERSSAEVTIALNLVEDPSRFGVVELDSLGRILRFVEKPALKDASGRLVNAGFYLMRDSVLAKIPARRKVSLETEVFPRLARAKRLYGRRHRGFWFDVGDMKDFIRANFFFLRRFSRRRIFVDASARVSPDVKLGADTIVGARVSVAQSSKLARSILFPDCSIGKRTVVASSVLADHVAVGNDVRISPNCIVSSYCRIADGVRLAPGVIVHPYKEIKESIRKPGHVL